MRIRQISQTKYSENVNGLSGVSVTIALWFVGLLSHCLPRKRDRMKTVAR